MPPGGHLPSRFSRHLCCRPSIPTGHQLTRRFAFFISTKIFTTARPHPAENNSADYCLFCPLPSRRLSSGIAFCRVDKLNETIHCSRFLEWTSSRPHSSFAKFITQSSLRKELNQHEIHDSFRKKNSKLRFPDPSHALRRNPS